MIKYCALSVALPLMFETFKLSLVSHSLRTVVSRCAVARVSGVTAVQEFLNLVHKTETKNFLYKRNSVQSLSF